MAFETFHRLVPLACQTKFKTRFKVGQKPRLRFTGKTKNFIDPHRLLAANDPNPPQFSAKELTMCLQPGLL